MLALVADDDVAVRSFVKAILLAEGFETLAAEDGDQALKIVSSSGGVDVMVSDIQMPGCDGITVARTVREAYPEAVIILMSGYPAPDADFEFIQKPFTWIEMRGLIRRANRKAHRLPPAA